MDLQNTQSLSPYNRHLSIIGNTVNPLYRAGMESQETPTHWMLECTGVAEQREVYLGSPVTFVEVLGNLGGQFGNNGAVRRT
ncbi:jg5876 [Pararge aegeria aegeria]|uniref:Jg5876 protein n=1 Tax=Pararge aegeria aegeria TaxID=348720 RepID=A0A8S4RHV3_9NEOP|nr:jg5876 [Pararge aegeria aegeria]